MELINLKHSENLKAKFLACHILYFYKNNMLPYEGFTNLITHTHQVANMFDTTYHYEQLFSKMKNTKSTLHSQLLNGHLSDELF